MKQGENNTTRRREALKKLLAGTSAAGLAAVAPEKWTAPVVKGVVLPAHAQTSVPLNYTQTNLASLPGGLREMLVPTANAGLNPFQGGLICVNFNADMQTYSARVTYGNPATAEALGNGTVGTPTALSYACGDQNGLWLLLLNGPSADGVAYELCDDPPEATIRDCMSDTLMPGDCSTASGGCPGLS